MQRPDIPLILSILHSDGAEIQARHIEAYIVYLERVHRAAYLACRRQRTCANMKVFCEDSETALERLSNTLEMLDNAQR